MPAWILLSPSCPQWLHPEDPYPASTAPRLPRKSAFVAVYKSYKEVAAFRDRRSTASWGKLLPKDSASNDHDEALNKVIVSKNYHKQRREYSIFMTMFIIPVLNIALYFPQSVMV